MLKAPLKQPPKDDPPHPRLTYHFVLINWNANEVRHLNELRFYVKVKVKGHIGYRVFPGGKAAGALC